ncbi:MAG: oligosaccharide flippase family protein [Deltaproteobacteria bacterium]|nr:oligosaccharide flippase family protein [Deltaproteobacteria bacterium]
MIRQFFKDSFLYGISSVVIQGIPILVLPVYVRLLSPLEYGALEIITIFAAFVNLTVALEITQGFARHYPDARTEGEKHEYASTALWFTLAAYGLFAGVALLFSRPLTAMILHAAAWENTLRVAIVATGLNGVYLLLQNQLRWQMKPLAYVTASMTYIGLSVSAGIFFIISYQTGVAGVFYGQIIGAVIAGCYAWIMGRKNYAFIFSRTRCKEMLTFSLPLIPSSISVIVAGYVDRIAIQNLMTLDDVGIYSAGFRVASIANILMAGIYFSLTPLIYQNYQKEGTPRDIARIFTYFLCGTLPVLMGLSLFSREILRLFTTPPYYGAWAIIPVLAVASVCSKMYIFAPGLDIEKKTKIIALINVAAAVVNVALNLLLIPHLGILGAALATLISAAILFFSYMRMSQKFYPIPYKWGAMLMACLVSALVILIVYVIPTEFKVNDFMLMMGKLLLCVVASIWIIRSLLVRK